LVQEAAVTQAVEATGDVGTGGPEPDAAQPPSRRDRQRAATIEEIISTARRLLVESGTEATSLRAIAREMGMTAPGLYRYFGSHEELLRHVCASIFTELGEDIHRAIHAASLPAGGGPAEDLTVKMVAACREFRRWALTHKAEFSMLFGVPLPGLDDGRYDVADECALAFAGTFFTLFLELWRSVPFGVPAAEEIDPGPARPARPLPRPAGRRHPRRRGAHVPALLDGAVRGGGDGGVRPHELRAHRPGPDVRDHPRRPGRPGRPALPAARLALLVRKGTANTVAVNAATTTPALLRENRAHSGVSENHPFEPSIFTNKANYTKRPLEMAK
jgi:AcrR family transcriptional regulator